MKSAIHVLFCSSLLVLPGFPAVQGEGKPEVPGKEPEALITELADESFRVREKATQDIWKLGDSVLPLLREAAESEDPERAIRARELLRKIQLHITPDTDPSIIALVERYGATTSIDEKRELLGKMRGKRAWRQMLKLFAAETDAEIRGKIQATMGGIAVRAARERLLLNDADGAREFLELAPADSAGLLALADFHRSHGTLEQELERARALDTPNSHAWQLALHRAAGDIDAARQSALAAGEQRVAAALAALAGDPLPWLRDFAEEGQSDSVAESYARAVSQRWLGNKARSSDLELLLKGLGSRNISLRSGALSALFLLGEVETAEQAFAKSNPFAAFRHFETLERVPEALEAIGLDPKDPDYKTWVVSQINPLMADDIEDQHEASSFSEQLAAMANFLERRGLHAEAREAFAEPMARMAEKDSDAFLDLLGSLFGTSETLKGAPMLAKEIAVAWIGEHEERWDDIVATVFGDDDATRAWWSWLELLAPESSRAERLDAMLALHAIGNDPRQLRRKWLDLAWEQVSKTPKGLRDPLLVRIFELSSMTGDVVTALRAWDGMPQEERDKTFWEQMIVFLSAEDRWDDVAELLLKQIATVVEAKQEPGANLHAYAAAALRMAGREEEAAVHDAWVDKLTLGSALLAIHAGNAYAFGRDYERAAEWWERAALYVDPAAREFLLAIKMHSDVLLEQGRWLETASTAEVLARGYASSEYRMENPLLFMRQRLQADLARAFSIVDDDRERAMNLLEQCHRTFIADGSLADHFFPGLRKMGLLKEHDAWFDVTWQRMEEIIKTYPKSDNTRNTAAWFASRALRKVDEGEAHLKVALDLNPDQPAYLDTMAEIHFARGNREKALEWSQIAVNLAPEDVQLRRQQERFRSEPFPQ
jgi:tetratricopeptide (TPR) repeat protein